MVYLLLGPPPLIFILRNGFLGDDETFLSHWPTRSRPPAPLQLGRTIRGLGVELGRILAAGLLCVTTLSSLRRNTLVLWLSGLLPLRTAAKLFLLVVIVVLTSFLLVVISTSSLSTCLLVVSSVVLVSFLLLVVLSIINSLTSDISIGTGFRVTGAGEEGLSAKLQTT